MTTDDLAAATALTHAFFAGLDNNQADAVAACMASDGVWIRQGKALEGADAVRAAVAARPADRATAHLITNLSCLATGPDSMTITFNLLAYLSTREASGWSAMTPTPIRACTDRIIRTPAGWRIQHKDSRQLLPPLA